MALRPELTPSLARLIIKKVTSLHDSDQEVVRFALVPLPSNSVHCQVRRCLAPLGSEYVVSINALNELNLGLGITATGGTVWQGEDHCGSRPPKDSRLISFTRKLDSVC